MKLKGLLCYKAIHRISRSIFLSGILCAKSFSFSTLCQMSISSIVVHNITYNDIFAQSQLIIPSLSHSEHKGSMGRVATVGGSEHYTGAPYYASMASLKFGADLAFVLCSKSSAAAIKSYSPELMVAPFYGDDIAAKVSAQIIEELLPRIHSMVIGPGLGRSDTVLTIFKGMIHMARDRHIPLVLDADALWLLSSDLSLVVGCQRCALTPNQAEFSRLCVAAADQLMHSNFGNFSGSVRSVLRAELLSQSDVRRVHALSTALGGVTVLLKGAQDVISAGRAVFVLRERGSPRRCGGQGDILAGCLGTSLHWASKRSAYLSSLSCFLSEGSETIDIGMPPADEGAALLRTDSAADYTTLPSPASASSFCSPEGELGSNKDSDDSMVHACILASVVTKRASELAFALKGRAMTSPDLLDHLGQAFREVAPVD